MNSAWRWLVWIASVSMFGAIVVCDKIVARSPLQMVDRAAEANLVHTYIPNTEIAHGSVWMAAGGAVADFNNNGLPDIFLLSGGQQPDRLFINQGDGTFVDEAEAWGLTQPHAGVGVAAGDFNNNGFIDLYITSFGNAEDGSPMPGRNKLYRNNGNGTFTDIAEQAGVAWIDQKATPGFGACWGDYNLNGDLDLFVAARWQYSGVLFMNNGDETFTDVTIEAGVFDPDVWGFQCAFADMNGDGWPDLLIAADYFTSTYYRNNGDGTFTDITKESGTGLDSNGMGHAVADVNNNGLLDWYVTSIYPGTQNPGNMLYLNQGDHQYVESAHSAGVYDGAWGWGTIAVDLDHKGWVDLIEVNGRFDGMFHSIPPRLFYNNADGTFTDIAVDAGMHHTDQGRGILRMDVGRNGLQDIIVMNYAQPLRYYRNETPDTGNWLGISFDTSTNPLIAPNGYGTRVIAHVGEKSYMRYMNGEPSYLATSELNVHFGLGDAQRVDTLEIIWPRGYKTTLHDVQPNQYLTITAPKPGDFNGDGVIDGMDLLALLKRWGPVTEGLDLHADLNNDGVVNGIDLLLLLSQY